MHPRIPCRFALPAVLLLAGASIGASAPFQLDGIERPVANASDPEVSRENLLSWPAGIGETFGTPVMHDLDGDGRKEVIACDRNRTYAFDATGQLLPGWPVSTGEVNNSPAVAYLNDDSVPEVIVASSGIPPRIHALQPDGSELPGFPVNLPSQYWLNVSCPAVADVDGDGFLDVGAQSEPGVAFFDRNGQMLPGWPYLWSTQQNIVWSAPAVADLDGDGSVEVVVGNNNLNACGVHVIRSDGTPMPGWPQGTYNIFSSAAVGDLDGDGDLEIVVQEGDNTWYGNRMHVWHHDGSRVPGWPRQIVEQWESSRSNPAIVDVDDDGSFEILTATCDSRIHLFRLDGSELPGYPRIVPGGVGPISTVQAIDSDGDRIEELFLCHYLNGGQWISGWHLDGTLLPGFPKVLYANSEHNAHGSAHLDDVEGDGDLDLVAQGGTFGAGKVWLYEVEGSVHVPGLTRAESPKIRRDLHNTGAYTGKAPASVFATSDELPGIRCIPNPVRAGGSFRFVGAGADARPRLGRVVDSGGRVVGTFPVDGGGRGCLRVKDLLGGRAAAGLYFLSIDSDHAGAHGTRFVVLP